MAERLEGTVPVRRTVTKRATALQRALEEREALQRVKRGEERFSKRAMRRQALRTTGEQEGSRDP
eukprot:12890263-Prorocentrum_lima.AAC.1